MTPADDELEDEPNDTPGDVVDSVSGRDVPSTGEDNGEVKVSEPALGVPLADQPSSDGTDEANNEEKGKRVVQLALGKLPRGTNDTPNNGSRSKSLSGGANEIVCLIRCTHAGDVREHPGLDAQLYCAGNDSAENLSPEHGTRGNFHVVTQLEVGGELKGLTHSDVPISLEQHHSDGATR